MDPRLRAILVHRVLPWSLLLGFLFVLVACTGCGRFATRQVDESWSVDLPPGVNRLRVGRTLIEWTPATNDYAQPAPTAPAPRSPRLAASSSAIAPPQATYRKIITRASNTAFFDATGSLSKFRAIQTDRTQSAEVGSLTTQATGTNVVRLGEAAITGAVKAFVPVPTP